MWDGGKPAELSVSDQRKRTQQIAPPARMPGRPVPKHSTAKQRLPPGTRRTDLPAHSVQSPPPSDFIHRHAPNRIGSAQPVRQPSIQPVKALCASIARQQPQSRIAESQLPQASPCCGDQRRTDTASPPLRINVESEQLPICRQIGIARRSSRREPADHPAVRRHHRRWRARVLAREVIAARPALPHAARPDTHQEAARDIPPATSAHVPAPPPSHPQAPLVEAACVSLPRRLLRGEAAADEEIARSML